jgi:hypothetical protein
MLGSRSARDVVTCIACGESVSRSNAREYDKHGNRWDRSDKDFEHLCKPCYDDLTHQPRPGLEDLLDAVEADADSRDSFLQRYTELAEKRRD